MAQIGLTATNLATASNADERTLPSPQPPSVLPSIAGYRLPVRSGTLAPNEGLNQVPMEAAVSSAPKDGDANVAEAANGARRNALPAVRPKVPECFPDRSPSLFPKQEWAGRVTAIANGTFDAHLRDLTAGGREVATIDLEEVSPEDRGSNARRFAVPLGDGVRDRERNAKQRLANRVPELTSHDRARPEVRTGVGGSLARQVEP